MNPIHASVRHPVSRTSKYLVDRVAAVTDQFEFRFRFRKHTRFSPNSRLIIYATHQAGREALMTTTLDGKIKARLARQSGDIREPDWGPVQK